MDKKLAKILTNDHDPVGWMALADMYEDEGEVYQANLWRRRGQWGTVIYRSIDKLSLRGFLYRDHDGCYGQQWMTIENNDGSTYEVEMKRTKKIISFKIVSDPSGPLKPWYRRIVTNGLLYCDENHLNLPDKTNVGANYRYTKMCLRPDYRRKRLFEMVQEVIWFEQGRRFPARETWTAPIIARWLQSEHYKIRILDEHTGEMEVTIPGTRRSARLIVDTDPQNGVGNYIQLRPSTQYFRDPHAVPRIIDLYAFQKSRWRRL